MSKEVFQIGNVLICNPQVNTGNGVSIEDLSIYVNIEVEIKGRNYCMATTTSQDSVKIVSEFDFGKKSIWEVNLLSTFYCNNTFADKEANTIEGVGIKSIKIDFDNWYRPMVNIIFVDVRGASLFMQREKLGSSSNVAQQFFSAFFNFPLPKYKLTIKGYYGEPMAYTLYCSDIKSEYDANTGNYLLNTRFYGDFFAFIDDLDMNYLRVSPYCENGGKKLWPNGYFSVFTFKNGAKIPTLDILYPKLLKLETEVEKTKIDTSTYNSIQQLQMNINIVTSILNDMDDIMNVLIPIKKRYTTIKLYNGYTIEENVAYYLIYDCDSTKGEYDIDKVFKDFVDKTKTISDLNKDFNLTPQRIVCGNSDLDKMSANLKKYGNRYLNIDTNDLDRTNFQKSYVVLTDASLLYQTLNEYLGKNIKEVDNKINIIKQKSKTQ
ncbi:MAG: hypothetical protein HUJ68_03705, partial [Clostridia bacterium]|nr:hypothetical protein [Clostridia bacterium]